MNIDNNVLEAMNTVIAGINLIATIVISISGWKITKKLTHKSSKEQQEQIKEQRIQQRKDEINIVLKRDFEKKWLYVNRLNFSFYIIQDKFKSKSVKIDEQAEHWKEFMNKFREEEHLIEEYNQKINFICAVNQGYIPKCVEESREELNYYMQVISDIAYEIRKKIATGTECQYQELADEAISMLGNMSHRIEIIVGELNRLYYE